MRKKVLLFFIILPLLLCTQLAQASTGFIGNPIWINPEFPREGEMVTLSALFHNGETEKLAGQVLFYDNDTLLGKKSLTIAAGAVGTATVTFKIESGNHVFSASAQGFQEISNSGSAKNFSLPLGKAEMSKLFVTKNGSGSGVDAVGLKASASAAPILNKVDQAENKVIDSIPAAIKDPVVATAQSMEAFRLKTENHLQVSVADSQEGVAKQKQSAADEQKKFGKVSPSTKYVNGPFASVKLFVAQLLLFLFSHAFIFYIVFFGILYFLIRSIFRKIKQMRNNRRVASRVAKKNAKE